MRLLQSLSQYSYAPSELRRCVRPEDVWKYKLTKALIDAQVEKISTDFYSSNFQVINVLKNSLRGKAIYPPNNLHDTLCLRRTDELLRCALSTTLVHRDREVAQLLIALDGEGEANILRTDIKSFFDSISFARIIDRLELDGFRNTAALRHLKSLNTYLITKHSYEGLPRGIGLSSTLADYMLHDLDQEMQCIEGISYYARYVDDICIIHGLDSTDVENRLSASLPVGLSLNKQKTIHLVTKKPGKLEFLGYAIDTLDTSKVSVADSKIEKIKLRLVLALKQFLKDKDSSLLSDRLKFLMCATRMSMMRRDTTVYCGIRHTYRSCSEPEIVEQLRALDRFYFGILRSKRYSISVSLRAVITKPDWVKIGQVSFLGAYISKITHELDQPRIAEIKRAWEYA
jgi:hypothetical protein